MLLVNKIPASQLCQRMHPRAEDIRGSYFRDMTAIIHSSPYRRLKHKTQVFFAPQNDHICTRIEHVMHVATISVTLCKALGLETDLAWAISVGHDLGHTPFGHTGEQIISEFLKDKGGFCHEINSLRVVDHLVKDGAGLNLTYAVRDGIINHCGEKFEQYMEPSPVPNDPASIKTRTFLPCTWEGIAVRMSDKIAYLGRDLEDALKLGIIKFEQIPGSVKMVLGSSNSDMINTMVYDAVSNADRIGKIGFSDRVYEAMVAMKEFNYRNIYHSDALIRYHRYIDRILRTLWAYLSEIFDKYKFDLDKYMNEQTICAREFSGYLRKMENFYRNIEKSDDYVISDYIAGMTDTYAIDTVSDLFMPRQFNRMI
ncbi:MAG: HD domain-containing protein [Spirochaetia bacterium]|nr:HD domain-containing protein [Spirochaetia bacterium]